MEAERECMLSENQSSIIQIKKPNNLPGTCQETPATSSPRIQMVNFDDEERIFYQIRKESEAQVNEVKKEIMSSNEGEMVFAIKFPLLIAWIHLI